MLSLIASMLKRRPVLIPVKSADARLAVFANTVERHLQNRKSIPDYMAQDPIYEVPKYVVSMCQDLCDLINQPDVKLIDVLRIEKTAVGHHDYQHKLALRCYYRTVQS